jgi:hypothetical protein
MDFDWKNKNFLLAAGGVAVLVFAIGRMSGGDIVLMSPAADNKVEQAYRRNGFGDRIMSLERRKTLSACYKKMLRDNGFDENKPTPKPGPGPDDNGPVYEGKVTFVFHIEEDGRVHNYELADSEFSDPKFSECIANSLKGIRFLPPPLGVNRYLAHDFVFKSDETYKKEMEERKNQAPLTLVTAAPAGGSAPAAAAGSAPASAAPPPPPPPAAPAAR